MRAYKHPQWLDAVSGDRGGLSLQSWPLFDLSVEELPQPAHQAPILWLCLGRNHRSRAVKAIVPSIRGRALASVRGISLHADPASTFEGRPFPVFILQGDLLEAGTPGRAREHATVHNFLPTDDFTAPLSPISFLCSQLLLPFVDVVALFLDDYPDVDAVAVQVAGWLQQGATSSRPHTTLPHLLVVSEQAVRTTRFLDAVASHSDVSLTKLFLTVAFITVDVRLSPQARYRPLKEELWHRSDDVRNARISSRYLFSARHLQELLRHRLQQLGRTHGQTFNFVQEARHHHAVAADLDVHLRTFLATCAGRTTTESAVVTVMASALVMDHYVPGMHDFAPREVFQTLYEAPARAAFASYAVERLPSGPRSSVSRWVGLLEKQFIEHHSALGSVSAAVLHLANVQRFRQHWLFARSVDTCLMCLRRVPDGPRLSCGHLLCTMCIRVYGRNSIQEPHTFAFPGDRCLLCAADLPSGFKVGLLPDTASLRLLSIDGGGYRGVGPMQMLLMLSCVTGVSFLARRAFDVVVGTSSGGAVAAGSFVKGWSEDECIARFEHLAHQAFQPHVQSFLVRLLFSYVCGSIYPSEPINQALQQAFGRSAGIHEDSWATRYGIRVAIPVSETPGNACYLFNNYNGRLCHTEGPGYQLIPDTQTPIPLWEMIRATTAAPGFFPPHYVAPCDKKTRDGAICYRGNCPIKIADCEARRVRDSVAYVVSLGTGASAFPNLPWRGRYLGLLADFISTQMECAKLYRDYAQDHPDLNSQGRLFRFDVDLDPAEAVLDAVSQMPQIRDKFRERYDGSPEMRALVDTVTREMFIFELDGRPEGLLRPTVRGRVVCRWSAGEEGYEEWRQYIRKRRVRVVVEDTQIHELVEDEGGLVARFVLDVDSRNPHVSVQIQLGDAAPQHIAQSPFSIPDIAEKQGLHTSFGLPQFAGRKRRNHDRDEGDDQQRQSKKPRLYSLRPRRRVSVTKRKTGSTSSNSRPHCIM